MRLNEIMTSPFNSVAVRLQRSVIGYSVCAISTLGATIMVTSAAILGLEPLVGSVFARLIVGGGFALIVLAVLLWLQLAQKRARRLVATPLATANPVTLRQAQFAQLAMIVEAVLLGYSLSRRR